MNGKLAQSIEAAINEKPEEFKKVIDDHLMAVALDKLNQQKQEIAKKMFADEGDEE